MKTMQLFLKAHYFFFWATLGAIFPFLPVYGKQLGITPIIMGSITTILLILSMIAKPIFGLILDYFHTQKKLLFMIILLIASCSYILLYFLPSISNPMLEDHQFQNISYASLPYCDVDYNSSASYDEMKNITCCWICNNTNFSTQLYFHTTEKEAIISSNTTCLLNINNISLYQEETVESYNCNVTCNFFEANLNLYTSVTFWGFVLLMSLSIILFSVSISICDAICLEILGKNAEREYGRQRVWGAIGYGLAALLTGYAVDKWSEGKIYKTYTPAFLFVFVLSCIDLICYKKLKVPRISTSTNIFADIYKILKFKSIIIFLCFTIITGACDGYILYFLLWYEEDLAMETGNMDKIKLIQGLTVAAEAFGSGTISMFLFDKILQKLGFGYTFALSLVSYAVRFGLISVAPTPWWIIPTELLMLGPSFAFSHLTVITFAKLISLPSISVSIQGIVGGIKDGFGIAVGNFVGSILLQKFGGTLTLRIFSILTMFSASVFFLFYITYLKHEISGVRKTEWRTPDDARKHCVVAE